MLIRVSGALLLGVDSRPITVEVDAGRGLPSFHIVGQGDRVVNESRDRIRAAFRQSGIEFPPGRVTVNLAPSDLPKTGSALDLPIAIAIAATRTAVSPDNLAGTLFVGELGLDAEIRAVRGALPLVSAAVTSGLPRAVVPLANLDEASACPGVDLYGAPSLGSVLDWLRDQETLVRPCESAQPSARAALEPDLADVQGQENAKRALEVAAAGRHNLRMVGPPGSGKTLLARRLPGLLPGLSAEEALDATRIHSVAGTLRGRALLVEPPFRAPHHTSSEAGMIGGGRPLMPGEISLAHRGVLFLDELPEFRRNVLEALRQPLEEGFVHLSRAGLALEFPARFQLIAAMNPCPCGYRGDETRECNCNDAAVNRYHAKLSGPLLDRIDLHVAVPPLRRPSILSPGVSGHAEPSQRVAERVREARARQWRRYRSEPFATNAELPFKRLAEHCRLCARSQALLDRAVPGLGLSMRGLTRVLRVARSIADLTGSDDVLEPHVAEAIGYRAGGATPGRNHN